MAIDHHNLCPGCMENKGASKACPHCGLPADAGPESALHLPPGTVLQDKYLLGRALGQGGFGITYLAWDLNLKLKLAIKEYLPLDMASRATGQTEISVYKKEFAGSFQYGLEKYLEEARTLARFAGHPSIVWVRDFFKANGTAYIVMEYVEGVTLKEYLQDKQEPLPIEQALPIFMPVLDALKEVHAEGILHRDISPDNLLISSRGRVVLIDFGAARQAVGEQSRSLSVIMKPGFSPEEQYHSKGKQGPWTDIYAVAASLYCTITGNAPPESLSRLSDDTLDAPSKLSVKLEPPLEKALLKAMAVKSKDRYQTVEEFQAALVAAGNKESPGKTPAAGAGPKQPTEPARVPQKKPEPADKPAGWAPQVAPAYSVSKKTVKTVALVLLGVLLIFGAVSLFGGGDDVTSPAVPATEEEAQGVVDINDEDAVMDEAVPEEGTEEPAQNYDPAIIADLDADYYIDSINGTIPLSDLPIGARVVDPGWEWEYKLGLNYSDEGWVLQLEEGIYRLTKTGESTPPGEVKPVTWLVVARDHYDLAEGHVTLLSEELIGSFAFDDSTDRNHEYAEYGYNHWGESGTGNAGHGLRPWLNSTGIHSGEGFYQAFSESFKSAVLTTTLPNREWQNGIAYSTQDKVFLPSTTELGDTEHDWTYQIGDVYTFFSGAGDEERVAMMVGDGWSEIVEKLPEEFREEWGIYGNKWFYWTRSPDSGVGGGVRGVSATGAFHDSSAYYDILGVRPALNLKSEILVSEINP